MLIVRTINRKIKFIETVIVIVLVHSKFNWFISL